MLNSISPAATMLLLFVISQMARFRFAGLQHFSDLVAEVYSMDFSRTSFGFSPDTSPDTDSISVYALLRNLYLQGAFRFNIANNFDLSPEFKQVVEQLTDNSFGRLNIGSNQLRILHSLVNDFDGYSPSKSAIEPYGSKFDDQALSALARRDMVEFDYEADTKYGRIPVRLTPKGYAAWLRNVNGPSKF